MAKKKARKAAKARITPAVAPVVEEITMPTTEPTETPVETPTEPVAQAPTTEAPKRRNGLVGVWAYIFGLVIAAGAAVFVQQGHDFLTYLMLAVLGIVVGLLNITDEEILLFLVATVALVISANSVRAVLENVPFLSAFLKNVIIFTAASAFVVSLKALFRVARNE